MPKAHAHSLDTEHQAHVLLIDSEPRSLRPLVEALRSVGHRVSLVFDGEQGYNRAASTMPDLIVMDVHLPRLDGYALCRWLKAGLTTVDIPVIFLSAASLPHDKLTGLRCGAVDYVTKPYSVEEVVARVHIHLRLARAMQAGSNEVMESDGAAEDSAPSLTGKADPAQSPAPMGTDEMLVRAAQRELLANLSATPSLDGIAERLGVNGRRLSRAFQRRLGMTLFEYLREERMCVARRLLCETPLSVAAIATELGYSSAANFTTAFRAHAGYTPSAYRQLPNELEAARTERKDFV